MPQTQKGAAVDIVKLLLLTQLRNAEKDSKDCTKLHKDLQHATRKPPKRVNPSLAFKVVDFTP